ncbi:TetR/AcrR family transcriptional regulator [Spiribacter halobius]|uniref:TetR family transcriptional regulator n=1 Tax=Sediminicurvatus halobius TaxID=2182432 RepID=A0A2U2N3A7_9GAMM|nr:TetR/AcrR family transcriptional regulator [Spiribacter halobius]PWG63518.1 TetR family transcriptional regulator [Spiribacter halobius]UEX79611.1 TetR/AcrR family transcriptional regulator [Spiribacter halobius]
MVERITERGDVLPLLSELFREHGFEGTTLALISQRTGLGKGNLYHLFPGGKQEMAEAVLAGIDAWFEEHVFTPLEQAESLESGLAHMFDAVAEYFREGHRICLVGAFALSDTRDRFPDRVQAYFGRWIEVVQRVLGRAGIAPEPALCLAEEVVLRVQGALVLARARRQPVLFRRALDRLREDLQRDLDFQLNNRRRRR